MAARHQGFTLIELVVVIAVTGIVAGLVSSFSARPLLAYVDVSRRAELVDAGDGALRRAGRDLRRALPNSIRVSAGGETVELLHVVDGGRYRAVPGVNIATGEDHTPPGDVLEFGGDASFNILGRFGELAFSYGVPLAPGHRVAIYPTGSGVWSDAATAANPGVITPGATGITIADDTDEDQLLLSSTFQFAFGSPRRRLYLVDGPITYLCALGAGTLTRYSGYGPTVAQPTDPLAAPLSGANAAVLATGVSACSFTYTPGTAQRAGLVTVDLTLARAGEQVRLFHEVHVVNVP